MENTYLFRTKSSKSVQDFIESLKENASKFDYYVRYVFNKRQEYEQHGISVDDHFNAYQVMLCSFNYKGLQKNIERLAILLLPKQVVVYNREGVTNILYLPFSEEFIREVLPEDEQFAVNQSKACQRIIKLIEASA